jgi:cell division protein FtsX
MSDLFPPVDGAAGSIPKRSRRVTVAALVMAAVVMSLLGATLFFQNHQPQLPITVWMNADATRVEINSVRSQLAARPDLRTTCVYQTKRQNYNEARRLLKPQIFAHLTVQAMVTNFKCRATNPAAGESIRRTFTSQAGVYYVSIPPTSSQK